MKVFLIDYENVNKDGLKGINSLDCNSNVIVFYNNNCTIPINLMLQLQQSSIKFEWIELTESGENALDFQITTYLGYIIARFQSLNCINNEIYIISKDNGYNSAIKFVKSKFDVTVKKYTSIENALNNKSVSTTVIVTAPPTDIVALSPANQSTIHRKINELLRIAKLDAYVTQSSNILNIFLKSNSLGDFLNALKQKFTDGNDIYLVLREYFKEYLKFKQDV
ncbi:MAG: PIN domain-containing protein [Oscillospiraceae bacterium]